MDKVENKIPEFFVIEKDMLISVLNNLGQGPYQHVAYAVQILGNLKTLKELTPSLEKQEKAE